MDFEKVISRLKTSLDCNFQDRKAEKELYKDGIINCFDAFVLELRDQGIISEKELADACHKAGKL